MSTSASLNRSAALASIAVALLLVGLKVWAVFATGSTAMLGSLADTVLDLVASLATLAGVWVAAQPDDENHRFGHGKAEALAAMFQVVLISISALSLAFRAVEQWIAGTRPQGAEGGIAVSLIAMAATFALLAWQRHVIRKTGSLAISTDHVHYQSDLLLNLAVIAALALDQYAGIAGADPFFGLAIALWLGWGAWGASQQAVDQLMDHEWPDERKASFLEAVARHPEIKGLHDLRTRTSGDRDFVQFHLAVDPHMTIAEAHVVMDEVEAILAKEFPGVEILIHPDPEGHVDPTDLSSEDLLAKL
ncbi:MULTISPECIES: cation diffusion facilitator family transporter [unclassified Novosphingobium]|uniref:cation diffusion facilitator family transporter n=1 Tax=unclassified Novosphingobium TaxID=2644732 RepID=UPI000EBE6DDF|nr:MULTISPECIES: cation diffusion facilitator family transporter [unclassified Novosphingobium]HCF24271.1 divalent metal cation transporter FieF [Novosphingobium sp.]HQV02480.1 cation diffusion facilitator family transporter [Novosphingobium sp.]